jgi:group I intron endonuclease
MIGIYKITSPSGKIYIGQSINIEKRFKYYKRKSCNGQTILLRSFNKYGVENHKFEIIEECSIELLNERERFYQDLYNVIGKNGLNCILTKTNDKSGVGIKHTEATKLKISIANTGKIKSIETRLLLSKSKIGNTSWIGKKHSEESKKLMSEKAKTLIILDINTGVYYYSLRELCKLINVKESTFYLQIIGKRKKNKFKNYILT